MFLRLFGDYVRDKVISPDCDNFFSVEAIKKWKIRSLDAEYCCWALRTLFSLCVRYNVRLRPNWIPGEDNVLADALSRDFWDVTSAEMCKYVRQAHGRPSPYCESLAALAL